MIFIYCYGTDDALCEPSLYIVNIPTIFRLSRATDAHQFDNFNCSRASVDHIAQAVVASTV